MNKCILTVIIAMIGFIISETMLVTAEESQLNNNISQSNSIALNSTNIELDKENKNIVVTWLNANEIKTDNIPMISISDQDFWKIFCPLLELSANGTDGTFESLRDEQ
jgi:pyridoxal/pyridoxine/pyridoxamine kinase